MARFWSLLCFLTGLPSTSPATSGDSQQEPNSRSRNAADNGERRRIEQRRVSEAFIDAANIQGESEAYHERAFYVSLRDRIKDVEFDPAPNIVFIIADQLRHDALGFIQSRMREYDGKLKVRTPNIDRIAASGVSFETAYCVSPSCGPARASIKTGASLQRTGILNNKLFSRKIYNRMDIFETRIRALETFEQILVEQKGYANEYYGKYHVPLQWFRGHNDTRTEVIRYNEFDYHNNTPVLRPEIQIQPFYQRCLSYLLERDAVDTSIRSGQQINGDSGCPYDPIRIDVRYGMPTNTPLERSSGFDRYELDDTDVTGRDSLNTSYTDTAIIGDMAVRALERLLLKNRIANSPFILGVSFRAPHPPTIAADPFFSFYHDQFENVLLPLSLQDPMRDSAYVDENQRKQIDEMGADYPYSNPSLMAEYTCTS
jgi:Sulfatase